MFLTDDLLIYSIKPFSQQAYPIQPTVTTAISSKIDF